MLLFFILITSSFASSKELPSQRLAIDDGGILAVDSVDLAIVGNTRAANAMLDKKRAIGGTGAKDVLGDITAQNMVSSLDFLVHLGDMVPSSSLANWKEFGSVFSGLVDGTTAPPSALRRIPMLPVVGDRDCVKSPHCKEFSKVFPGFGQEIGYGRVATWQGFDLSAANGKKWRVVVIDSNKEALGSRWREQSTWLQKAVREPGQGLLVFVHESPIARRKGQATEAIQELMDLIGTNAPLLSLKGVFSAGVANNQLYLPEGALGPIHVVAGGGGAPGHDLHLGVKGDGSEPALDLGFSRAIEQLVSGYESLEKPPSEKSFHQALGTETFDGFPRVVSAGDFPPHGWWKLTIHDEGLRLIWRAKGASGSFADQGVWTWSREAGWKAK